MITDKEVLKELMHAESSNSIIEQLSRNYISKGIDYRVKRHKKHRGRWINVCPVMAS